MSSAFLCRTVSSCGRRVGEPTRKGLKMRFCPKVFNRSLVSNMSNYVQLVIKIHICRSFIKILIEIFYGTLYSHYSPQYTTYWKWTCTYCYSTGLVHHKMYTLRCDHCMWSSWCTPHDAIRHALWPINSKLDVFIDFNLMLFMSVLQHESPTLSLGSLLKSLLFMPSLSGQVRNCKWAQYIRTKWLTSLCEKINRFILPCWPCDLAVIFSFCSIVKAYLVRTLKATYIPQSTNRHQREIGLQTIFANIKHSQKIHRHLVMAAIDGHYELTPLSGYGINAGVVNF